MTTLVSQARDLAHRAHAGQVDKAGRPYIEHVARVAAVVRSCDANCQSCDEAEAVAWLHDVLEDCGDEMETRLCEELPIQILVAVIILTRSDGINDNCYYTGIRNSPLALRVKLADIADNMDEARLALLDDKTANRLRRKYAKALAALTS